MLIKHPFPCLLPFVFLSFGLTNIQLEVEVKLKVEDATTGSRKVNCVYLPFLMQLSRYDRLIFAYILNYSASCVVKDSNAS
jgi:uncharacterized membrane protein